MNAPVLHIRRWNNEFVLARDCPSPERVRQDLEEIAGRLPDELAAGLAPWLSEKSGPVVLIRRLAFECELDLSREPEFLAARWAYGFAKALVDAVETGTEEVLRFPSPAAYRARYITDLAAGSGSAWYYRPFSGLSVLPAAGAIRTVLLEDAELGRETLAALPPEAWPRLGSALTRREALRILEGLSAGADGKAAEPAALAAVYREHASRMPAMPWFATALFLFAAALRAGIEAGGDLARWVRLAAKLPVLAASPDAPALAGALRRGDVAALVAADSERDAESWAGLAARPEWRAALAEALRAETGQDPASAVRATADAARTAFGGLILLLPELDSLLDGDLAGALPPFERAPARNLAAWLVLALCAGRDRAVPFLGEAFWRDLFGVPAAIDRTVLLNWLAGADAAPAAARLAERAAALARGSRRWTMLRAGGRRWAVAVDQATSLWCEIGDPAAAPVSDGTPWRTRLADARRVRDDWRHLAMDWGLPEAWQRLFIQSAQILLRRFAFRIPGFAGASLPYVFANFLAGPGTLDAESGHLRLTRPPLHVMLNLTGIGRGAVHWPGPPERGFVLEYEP
jgi:hypothetical protein